MYEGKLQGAREWGRKLKAMNAQVETNAYLCSSMGE